MTRASSEHPRAVEESAGSPPAPPARRVRTIHDDVDECTDEICCCEPEPRWQKVRDEAAAR